MEDFNSFVNDAKTDGSGDIMSMVNSLASKFDGKSTNDLLSAIYKEAKKGKANGTLTNSEIDNFSAMLSPMLNDRQREYLRKIAEELKKI